MNDQQDYKPSHWIGIVLSALILGPIIGGIVGMTMGGFLGLGHNTAMLVILLAFVFSPIAGVATAFVFRRSSPNDND